MNRFRLQDHLQRSLYCVCWIISSSAMTCLTGVRHFDVPDLSEVDGVVLASNHQSFLDPMLVGMAVKRPVHYLARKTLFDPPVFGRLIRALGAHPLRRGGVDSTALRAAMRVLRRGEPLLLFPEGTRTRDGSLGTFRPGVAGLAIRCRVPIIPVCVEGAFQAWPRSRVLPHPAPAAVAFGEPIDGARMDPEELTNETVRRIVEMREFLRSFLEWNVRGWTGP